MRAAGGGMRWCPACNVSAPPEYRRCVHCAAKLSNDPGTAVLARGVPSAGIPDLEMEPSDEPFEAEVEADEAPPPASGLRRGMNIIWLFLVLSTVAYRACAS